MDVERLIAAAAEVRLRAYAPYSRFLVGAALELHDFPSIFVGCNVENASYGLTICAERMALGAAIAATDLRKHAPKRIVVVAKPLATPCGACRQCLAEFGLDWEALCVDASDLKLRTSFQIQELLPNNFRLD